MSRLVFEKEWRQIVRNLAKSFEVLNANDSCFNWTYDMEVILFKMSRYSVEWIKDILKSAFDALVLKYASYLTSYF